MSEDFLIRAGDLKVGGYCRRGSRVFAAMHGIDYADFMANGIMASRLLETNDALATRFVEKIREIRGL